MGGWVVLAAAGGGELRSIGEGVDLGTAEQRGSKFSSIYFIRVAEACSPGKG